MSTNPNLFLSLGKPVKDEYGRSVGRIISFALTPSGKFDSAYIELSDGKFSKQPMDQLTFNGADVTLNSKIRTQTNLFCDQIPFLWRKNQALKDLSDKKKINPDLYNELHTNFEGVLAQLRKDAQSLQDEITGEIARCQEEIKSLNYALMHLELEHEVGKLSEDAYKSAFAMLQEALKRGTTEKTDLELSKTRLSNILLGDNLDTSQKSKTYAAVATNEPTVLPEPPVVVYVKEIGKAGV